MFGPVSKPENKPQSPESSERQPKLPSISLPKGGGAIRGIEEKFAANPVTGTGSLNVPIFTSPGRSGFGPQLSLSYDSGSGNGPFGFGWSLSLPSVSRKTDKGLPRYFDMEESDVFILSGAEDLVPVGSLHPQGNYSIKRYRPRTEGLFARIEQWIDTKNGDMFWRSISKDNITTIYGKTADSRIIDPDDPNRVFSWMISESYDDKGNAIYYEYTKENSINVDITKIHEKNRTSPNDSIRSVNRYLHCIRYGNKIPYKRGEDLTKRSDWMFELVFDYCKRDLPLDTQFQITLFDNQPWDMREDPFSSYRSGFEVRTYRLCHRILMFHHFPKELEVQDYLVRSTDFTYEESPIASFITKIHQSGYVLKKDSKTNKFEYIKKSLPPLEFEYSKAELKDKVEIIDHESLRNLPIGLNGSRYQWLDLDSEGISGIFTEQGDGWYFKPNLGGGKFGEIELIRSRPSTANLSGGEQQLIDLAGDGQLDVVEFEGPLSGFYERTPDGNWDSFKPFTFLPNITWNNPNLKHVDLSGDGHADILILEGETITWYPSLAELGFGQSEKVYLPSDEEKGPRLVFADGTQSVYLADLSGDGLSDLVRIRNGEICYWPNLGYGNFGKKVTMDNSPVFDTPDLFDQKRIRLADIDGSGTTDILYLHHDRVDVYFNECGNCWSSPQTLMQLPQIDNLSSVMTVDLFGNGTACLVWSSPLPGSSSQQMSYIKLMGDQKPHLLICTKNNIGAETRIEYESSTKFYLEDKAEGRPWITRLPFPVHVVSRVFTCDWVSRNLFVTQYKYHHGFFDGIEREFRGFGMVEQVDTEKFDTLIKKDFFQNPTNIDETSHVPPVLTKTWYHTGAYLREQAISLHMAHEYYGAPDPNNQAEFDTYLQTLLEDTILPENLTAEEEREACRALKGSVLRQEIYALDGTIKEYFPYSVSERNYIIRCLQQRGDKKHAVFFVHPRETLDYHYERNPSDPRIGHTMTFEVDDYGNLLKSVAIGYGRLKADPDLSIDDQNKQNTALVTYTENRVTKSIDDPVEYPDDYRAPLPCEAKTYQLTGYSSKGTRYCFEDFLEILPKGDLKLSFEFELKYEDPYKTPINPNAKRRSRIIEHIRTLYRSDTLDGLLQLGKVEPKAIPGETYKLAFTPGLLSHVYQRKNDQNSSETLLSNTMQTLHDDGGYILSQVLESVKDHDNDCLFPPENLDDHWWIPSGKIYYWPYETDDPNKELDFATNHFFLPHRFDDPFGNKTFVFYDSDEKVPKKNYNFLLTKTIDPLENTVFAQNDYRVLQPKLMTDPNGNRSAAVFDALGMVVGTAVMGKAKEPDGKLKGDTLEEFKADITLQEIQAFVKNPRDTAPSLLEGATSRIIYDIDRFWRCDQPPFAASLIREIHQSDLGDNEYPIQINVTYSDGFGREIQTKIQAESGNAPKRKQDEVLLNGDIIPGKLVPENGKPDQESTDHRWVGKGRTVYNNKGKPVKQYEPFFSNTHLFEEETEMTDTGVTPVLFYDPLERIVATLHPNHTYEKVVFDPWKQETWDVNDTIQFLDTKDKNIKLTDPSKDPDVGDFFKRLSVSEYLPTWYESRINGQKGVYEKDAAQKALEHARTPSISYLDSLGRTFLTVADNGIKGKYKTRVEIDIEGNQRYVIDALNRTVMRYDYDMLGNRIKQDSMDAGIRWMLSDVTGKQIYGWDSRKHKIRHVYDQLRRLTHLYVQNESDPEQLAERIFYGEIHPDSNPSSGAPAPLTLNLRGKLFLQLDSAGVIINYAKNPKSDMDPTAQKLEAYDFKGNLLRSIRRIAKEYHKCHDWKNVEDNLNTYLANQRDKTFLEATTLKAFLSDLNSLLEPEEFTNSTTYDALNRPVTLTMPDKSIIYPSYNEANLLESISANLCGAVDPTSFIKNIDYNAKGQRELIEYGNGVKTKYGYDRDTFRLTDLFTTRGTAFPNDCSNPNPCFDPPDKCPNPRVFSCGLQNLHYTYDPVGNITHILDDAQQTIFFKGQVVKPENEYTYDAIYRLIKAHGREHKGQAAVPHTTWNDTGRVNLEHPHDGNKMTNYFEYYQYDEVGNIQNVDHKGSAVNWIREYKYNDIIKGENCNRLSRTIINPNSPNPISEPYTYDLHGNMTSMPHLPEMTWDFKDQLQWVEKSKGSDECSGCKVYFTYDASGQRVRKVVEQDGNLLNERIYIGGYEIYRKYNGGNTDPILERVSLHIMDDKQRIALIDTKTVDKGNPQIKLPETLIRYQLGNHLSSASLELDEKADVISYEEYYPYGSTSYQAVRSKKPGSVEVSTKRYRYTGKERDEETGLYYHGARYYAPWLSRWVNPDPLLISIRAYAKNYSTYIYKQSVLNEINLYLFSADNPLKYIDPTGLDIEVNPLSQWTAEQFVEKIKSDTRIPSYLREGFTVTKEGVKGSIHVKPSVQLRIPKEEIEERNKKEKTVPYWYQLAELASSSNKYQITTAEFMKEPGRTTMKPDVKPGTIGNIDIDKKYHAKKEGVIYGGKLEIGKGMTLVHYDPKIKDYDKVEVYNDPPTDRALVFISNRLKPSDSRSEKETKNLEAKIKNSGVTILHEFSHAGLNETGVPFSKHHEHKMFDIRELEVKERELEEVFQKSLKLP